MVYILILKKILLKIKLFFILINFERKYLYYTGYQIGVNEKLIGKKLDYYALCSTNRYLAKGIRDGYETR